MVLIHTLFDFFDEASVNYSMSYRLYGAAESSSRAFDVSTHKQGENYTIFVLVSLNDLCYVECELASTDGIGFINFIHRACTAFNDNGEHIVPPGTLILTDSASIHGCAVQRILKPYMDNLHISHYFLPKFSLDTNCAEEFIGTLKLRLCTESFQQLVEFSVPTAVLAATEMITSQQVYNFFKDVTFNYMNM